MISSAALLLLAAVLRGQEANAVSAIRPGDRAVKIPTVDMSHESDRQVVIAEGTDDVYQGHPTTVLMPDGKTLFCVWTLNHGGPCGPMKRSPDGGKTWSGLLPVPDNWRGVRNCPTIHRLVDPEGVARLFVFAGQGPGGTMHQSYSEDDGATWTPMAPNGLVCVMPFCAIEPIDDGRRLLAMTNIRRPGDTEDKLSNVLAQSVSSDGGKTWSDWRIVLDIPGCRVCEPEIVRSPDGEQLLCLIRENNRAFNGWMMISDDEGETWSSAKQLPASLSGDRHMARYAPDGRLVVCFRDTAQQSPTKDHFVAWVGTYDDIVSGRDGHYRVKLLHSHAGMDCGYPGLESLPDGTFVATTYIKYRAGAAKHSVVCVRFTLDELDRCVMDGIFVGSDGAPSDPLAWRNLASGATAAASSLFPDGGYSAGNVLDGRMSLAGRWVSARGDVHWVTLMWPQPVEISRVRVWTGYTGRPELRVNDYTLQWWDGQAWQVAASVVDNDRAGPEECNDLRFGPVTTTRLKMEVTRTPTGHARVFEIGVYGPPEDCVTLGSEPQLFVDDDRVSDRAGVTRVVHACDKLPEPVMETEMPWEGNSEDSRIYIYGTVLRDAESGQFRMWYNRMDRELYATSADGIHWDRPELGLVEFRGSRDNNLLPVRLHSPSVIYDEREPDASKRYKMLGCMVGKPYGYGAAFSADGLHWHMYPKNPVLAGGDTCTLAQDPDTGEYLAFHKLHRKHRGHSRRLVYLATSRDMQTWSEPRLVMAPDATDDAQTLAEGGRWSEFYNLSVFPYGGQYLGLVTHFRFCGKPPRKGPGQSPHDGPIDVQLVHSRDGRVWRRLEVRQPVIPNGPYAYDAGSILGTANQPVLVGDDMWVYYTAITTTHGGFLPEKKITIARASWRRDGFVSLEAGEAWGTVETVPFRCHGRHLCVNADAGGGELRVEVLGAAGRVIPGYGFGECRPLGEDRVRHALRWGNHERLPENGPVALRFHLRNAHLYSYTVADDG